MVKSFCYEKQLLYIVTYVLKVTCVVRARYSKDSVPAEAKAVSYYMGFKVLCNVFLKLSIRCPILDPY